MKGGMGQVPRGTSEDIRLLPEGEVREVRGDPRGRESQSRDREGSVGYATGGSRSWEPHWSFAPGCGKVIVSFLSIVTGSDSHRAVEGEGRTE